MDRKSFKKHLTRRLPDGSRLDIEAGFTGGKDGHFSVTASRYYPMDRTPSACGCLHEDVLAAEPRLAPVVAVHLCDAQGAPMHARANAEYHLREKDWDRLAKHLRCTEKRARKLEGMTPEDLAYELTWSFAPSWRADASAAFAVIESLEGEEHPPSPLAAECASLGLALEQVESKCTRNGFVEKYRLRRGRRSVTVSFQRGSAVGEPDAATLVDCIIGDYFTMNDGELELSKSDERAIQKHYDGLARVVGDEEAMARLTYPKP